MISNFSTENSSLLEDEFPNYIFQISFIVLLLF